MIITKEVQTVRDRIRVVRGALWIAGILCIFAVLVMVGSAREDTAPQGVMAFTTHQIDPTGDVFGVSPLHDVTDVLLTTDGTTLTVVVAFSGTIGYPGSSSNDVMGFLDFDTDQDATTGIDSHLAIYPGCAGCSALGIDYYIDLASYNS
jgi:hypothetical protein